MIEVEHDEGPGILKVRASGTLTGKDYDAAIPEIENAIKLAGGKMRILVSIEDLGGVELEALWKDLKFDVRHAGDMERVAVVGDSSLAEWATKLSAPFFRAEVRAFQRQDEDKALAWLRGTADAD